MTVLLFSEVSAADELSISLDPTGSVSLTLVRIPGGRFVQGSPEGESGREAEERTRQVTLTSDFLLGTTEVTVGQFRRFVEATGYRTEAETGKSGGYGVEGGQLVQKPGYTWKNPGYQQTDQHPVTIVTWGDAQEFVKWLSRQSGRRVFLPTEAQWEYACRAGSETALYRTAGTSGAIEIVGERNAPALDSISWYGGNSGVEFEQDDGWDSKDWDEKQYPHVKAGTRKVSGKAANGWGLYDMLGNV